MRAANGEAFSLAGVARVATPAPDCVALGRLIAALRAHGAPARVAQANDPPATVFLRIDHETLERSESYRIRVDGETACVTGADPAGLFYGTQTLAQIVESTRRDVLRPVRIEDRPSFPHRGVMLDVSRDRVPTMKTLFALVDRFASWKFNQLQLYTEHTFAYRAHENVWRNTGAFSPDEIRKLDAYCAARHVELVPNQQSFGHMHHWLVHEPYRALAECPEGVDHPFSRVREPFSLCATDPKSLEFVDGLYDELLPCFRSSTVNIGGDETFDLGQGRSSDACAEHGEGRVYLDYLCRLAKTLRARGKRMQFWADIVLNHPELVDELPRDSIPMLWGYEANHPFESETRHLLASGLDYYVCPGTSSWQSLAGRFSNMVENIEGAVLHGRSNGAVGVMVTDWGDRGHLQPQTASYAGWIAAADLAWNANSPAERRSPDAMAELLSIHAFEEELSGRGGGAGRAAVRLAQVCEVIGARVENASPLSIALTKIDEAFPPPEIVGLTGVGVNRAGPVVAAALDDLERERMSCPDRDTIRDELRFTARILDFARALSFQRLRHNTLARAAPLPQDKRAELLSQLTPLIDEHRRLWCLRSRPDGLSRSASWLERVAEVLAADAPDRPESEGRA